MFSDKAWFKLIRETRVASKATEYDIGYIDKIKEGEIDIVMVKMDSPVIAIGKQQKIDPKYDDMPVIKKATNGTAVYFDGSEMVISIIIDSKAIKNMAITTSVQKYFVGKMNETLNDLCNIKSNVVQSSSRHEYKPDCCFNALTKGEIEINGNKLVGCSFTRYGHVLIGHMMLYINNGYSKLYDYMNAGDGLVKPIGLHDLGIVDIAADQIVAEFYNKLKKRDLNK